MRRACALSALGVIVLVEAFGVTRARGQGGADMSGGHDFLTIGEAAALCGLSPSALRRAVAQGHLPAWHTPGNHLRIGRSDFVDFLLRLGATELAGRAAARGPASSVAASR
jgi:excisionase family DNA binding protein